MTLAAASLLFAATARAEVDLEWDAPARCPEREEVLKRIRALAGESLDNTPRLSAKGTIAHQNGRFWLTLQVRDGRAVRQRVIASDSCADLAGAAAVTLVLLLGGQVDTGAAPAKDDAQGSSASDARAPGERESSSGEKATGSSAERAAEQPAELDRERDEQSRTATEESAGSDSMRPWQLVLRGPVGTLDLGPLPQPSLGVGLGVGVRFQSWWVLLAGHLSRGQTINGTEPNVAFGAELERASGQLTVCRGWRSLPFEVAPCLGLALERVTARGFGDGVAPQATRAVWLAPSAGLVARWYALRSLAFFADVSGYVELSRPRLVVQGLGDVARLAPVAAGATVGAEWIL